MKKKKSTPIEEPFEEPAAEEEFDFGGDEESVEGGDEEFDFDAEGDTGGGDEEFDFDG